MKLNHLAFAAIACLLSVQVMAQEAETIAETVEVPGTPVEKVDPKVRPLTVVVELSGNSGRISGTLVDSNSLSMKTSFGEAAIPLSEVAGVRLASGEDVSTTVVMLNGDSITGAIDIKQLTVETEWGTATIKGSSIQSMLFVPNVQWNATSNLSGRRWTLIDSQPKSATPTPTSATPAASTRQVIRNGVIVNQ
jgi:hypothetical protein